MNIYIPTEEECLEYYNPNYIPPSMKEMMEGATRTNLGHPQFGSDNGMYGKTISDEQKAAIGKKAKELFTGKKKNYKTYTPIMNGKENPRARKIHAEGKVYETIRECCNAYGFKNHNAIRYRLNHPKWTEWFYL